MGKRANQRTPARGSRVRNKIHSRRLAASRRAEQAWEEQKAEPIREMMRGMTLTSRGVDSIREMVEHAWPTRNKTKRGFLVWGITKSMRSRARRKLNDVVVAD